MLAVWRIYKTEAMQASEARCIHCRAVNQLESEIQLVIQYENDKSDQQH